MRFVWLALLFVILATISIMGIRGLHSPILSAMK